MSLTECVTDFLRNYPGLEELQTECVPEGEGFGLMVLGEEPVRKEYLDGSRRMTLRFSLLGRMGYGEDRQAQQQAAEWFEEFQRWLGRQTPRSMDLGAERKAESFRGVTAAAVEQVGENGLCCWGMTLELKYVETDG